MFTYGFVPFAIMLVCSIIIIHKLYSAKRNHLPKENKIKSQSFFRYICCIKSPIQTSKNLNKRRKQRNSMSKQMQVTSILLTTNFLFFFLVSPLLIMNVLNMLQEDTLKTTLAYFLCYANHGYLKIKLFT
jgi:hypothetical protein